MAYLSLKAVELAGGARHLAELVLAGDRVGDIVDQLAAKVVALSDDITAHRRTPDEGPPKPAPLGPDDRIPESRLIPGLEVYRWTEPARGKRLSSDTPCCDRRLLFPIKPERLDLDNPPGLAGLRMCGARCRRLWTVTAVPDSDGGHWARWRLAGLAG